MFTTTSHDFQRAVLGTVGTVLFAGLCLSGAMAPAHAAEAPAAQTVSYADLNLANAAGRATFDQRVKAAAEAVCSTGLDTVAARTAEAHCVRDAIAAATVATQG